MSPRAPSLCIPFSILWQGESFASMVEFKGSVHFSFTDSETQSQKVFPDEFLDGKGTKAPEGVSIETTRRMFEGKRTVLAV